MGIYRRPDSAFWWLCLERPGQRPIREATRIPADGGTPGQTRQNHELAQAAYSVRMGDLARRRYDLPTARPIISFAKFREWYAEQFSAHKRGLSRERSMLRQLGATFDDRALDRLTRRDILEWRTARRTQVSASTVNRELQLLKHVLAQAVPEYLEANPAAGVPQLRQVEIEPRIIQPDEERRLLATLDGDAEGRAVILCALDTLQRLSSVLRLARAQDHGAFLTVLNPKTKGYQVPVSRRLRRALDALEETGPQYFPRFLRDGAPAATAASLWFRERCQVASIPIGRHTGGVSFHCLRHTGASRMIERGVDLETVRRIGGWADLKVLQKYLHPTDQTARSAVEAIGRRP